MRIALGIEYDGQAFFGWQAQENLPTVQGQLEAALAKIANEPVHLYCAGRTDAGVHATGQVVHFETQAVRPLHAWVRGTNTYLPSAIAVRWVQEVDPHFHARFSAVARRYRYVIYNHRVRPALMAARVTWHCQPLDASLMQQAAQCLLGEQDFSSFRASECDSRTPMRNVHEVTVKRQGDFVILEIEANAFLHHMVRNIVGVLLQVGSKRQPIEWVQQVLLAKDRRVGAETAPATGLYLINVHYPEPFFFSEMSSNSLFF